MPNQTDGERPGPNRNMVGVKWILSKHAPRGSESILDMKFLLSPPSLLFSLFFLVLCNSVLLCLFVTVKWMPWLSETFLLCLKDVLDFAVTQDLTFISLSVFRVLTVCPWDTAEAQSLLLRPDRLLPAHVSADENCSTRLPGPVEIQIFGQTPVHTCQHCRYQSRVWVSAVRHERGISTLNCSDGISYCGIYIWIMGSFF